MSYDKKIGLDLNNPLHRDYLRRLNIEPIINDLDALLPNGPKEPEPKLWLPTPRSFHQIRSVLNRSANSFVIPGQVWEDKKPLVSMLVDTHVHGFPTALLDQGGYSLRLRFEMDPYDRSVNQYDYNEKSSMGRSQMVGGLADRDEREEDFTPEMSLKDGYDKFIQKYRGLKDPTFCNQIGFEAYRAFAGYIAGRNEYGFAIKHPQHNVLFVMEGCDDIFDTLMGDMCRETQSGLCEWEFERRQVIGRLPSFATRSREAFKHYLYSSMDAIRNDMHQKIAGSLINYKSKAEVAKEHLINHYSSGTITELGLSAYYDSYAPTGFAGVLTPVQQSLRDSRRIETTLRENSEMIFHRCGMLNQTKLKNNKDAQQPEDWMVGNGNSTIRFDNDNGRASNAGIALEMG